MANSLLTVNMITREAIELFLNSNAFLQSIDRQFDSEFQRAGMKIMFRAAPASREATSCPEP